VLMKQALASFSILGNRFANIERCFHNIEKGDQQLEWNLGYEYLDIVKNIG
jgi:hypothetical protein